MSDSLLSVDQVALRMGVGKRAVYGLVDLRQIPFTRIGRRLRFESADIEAYIAGRRTEPAILTARANPISRAS